jgi:hypothetical protein
MILTRQPHSTKASVLFALAGVVSLISVALNHEARPLIIIMQSLTAVLFFVASYLHYRKGSGR